MKNLLIFLLLFTACTSTEQANTKAVADWWKTYDTASHRATLIDSLDVLAFDTVELNPEYAGWHRLLPDTCMTARQWIEWIKSK